MATPTDGKTIDALCRAHADACRVGDRELASILRSRIAAHCSNVVDGNVQPVDRGTVTMTQAIDRGTVTSWRFAPIKDI